MANPQTSGPTYGLPTIKQPSPWAVVATVLVGLWAVGLTIAAQSVGWLSAQFLLITGLPEPAWLWPVAGLLNALLIAAPAALLGTLPRSPGVRAAGRVWLLAAVGLGLLAALRAVPMPQHEVYLAALALVAGLIATVRRWTVRRWTAHGQPGQGRSAHGQPGQGRSAAVRPAVLGLALTAGLLLLLPWLWVGALGGLLESLLAVTAAGALGWLAATTLDGRFWTAYRRRADGRPLNSAAFILLSGLVAGVALLLLAAATGQSGAQLAAMLVLPPIGLLAASLAEVTHPGPATTTAPVGWLVAVASVGPLALIDPEEVNLLLVADRDVPYWTTVATVGSLAVGLILALGYGLSFGRNAGRTPGRRATAAATVLLLLAAGAVHFGPGQPGLHGERLFVILTTQADLTGVPAQTGPAGRQARAREVHRRLVDTAERSQRDLRRELDRWRLSYTPYYLVNAVEVDAGPVVRAWLSRRSDVARVLVNQRLRPLPAAPPVDTGSERAASGGSQVQWNLSMIGADRVWSELGVDGSGIVVGGSDSGVDGRHPTLAAGYRGGDDSWYDPWQKTRTPTDLGWHGTHTLATAVGSGGVGVAPGAQWVGCVNLGRNLGNPARYLDCLQFMLAPFPAGGDPFTDGRPERGPEVLTNSWGCPPIEGCDLESLRPASAALAAAGVFVVAAAGNTGPYCDSIYDPPAPYADVFTVGAVDDERRVTEFSSRGPGAYGGPKPDLVAPGAGIRSAMPGDGYGTHDGTSMATPHVAGVVALMWSANPALIGDLERTRSILRNTVTRAEPPAGPESTADGCEPTDATGAGLVDAYAAVRVAR